MEKAPIDRSVDNRIQDWIGSILAGTPGVHDVRVLVGADDDVDGVLVRVETSEVAEAVRLKLATGSEGPDAHRLDPEHVYIALPPGASTRAGVSARVALEGVDVMLTNERARVRVRLARGGQRGIGIESGAGGQMAILRLVCDATVAALRELEIEVGSASLESLTLTEVGGAEGKRRLVLALYHVTLSGWDGELTGTAVIRRTDAEAAARAVLDALNRHAG
ncbi:MAG: hypothetical protein CME06_02570 [Gemmatimonadetes bacterium]|nr:hypothetical protein [Gemmatimonadota bacterium]